MQQVIEDTIDRILQIPEVSEVTSPPGNVLGESNDQEVWEVLRAKADALDQMAKAFTEAATLRACAARRHSNQFSPINRLPVEILVYIFKVTLSVTSDEGYYRVLYQLIRVSSFWSRTITSTTHLWNLIPPSQRYSYENPLTRLVLQRCDEAPLRISSHEIGMDTGCDEELCRKLGTWKSAHLILGTGWQFPKEGSLWRTDAAPRLEELKLQKGSRRIAYTPMGEQEEGSVSYDPFGGTAPVLRKMVLKEFEIHWESELFSRLEVLKIGWTQHSSLTLAALCQIMQRCSGTLQELVLKRANVEASDNRTGPQIPVVDLPHLTTLSVLNTDPASIRTLLSQIIPQHCNQLFLEVDPEETTIAAGDIPLFNKYTTHFLNFIKNAISSAQRISVALPAADSFRISVWRSQDTMASDMTIRGLHPMDTFDWAVTTFRLGEIVTPISVVECLSIGHMVRLYSLLDRLPSVCALKTAAALPDLSLLIGFLEKAYVENNVSRWRFPNLQSLTFYDIRLFPLAAFLAMLKSRYGKAQVTLAQVLDRQAGDGSNAKRLVEKTKPFTKISFLGRSKGVDEKGISQIARIVGEGVVKMREEFIPYHAFAPPTGDRDLDDEEDPGDYDGGESDWDD